MSNAHADHKIPKSEKKSRTEGETAQEMAPFAIYAAIPIILTICIAFYFGSR